MILYLDTSALVPLLIEEPGSADARRLVEAADAVASSVLAYAEAAAAIAQAERLGRMDAVTAARVLGRLDEVWARIHRIGVGDGLVRSAAELARRHGLRGYDAVHCASALALAGPGERRGDELVAVAGDRRLLAAWREEGMLTASLV